MDTKTLQISAVAVFAALSLLGLMFSVGRRERPQQVWAVGLGLSALGNLIFVLVDPALLRFAALPAGLLVAAFTISVPWGLRIFLGSPRPWPRRFWVVLVVWALLLTGSVFLPVRWVRTVAYLLGLLWFNAELAVVLLRYAAQIPVVLRLLLGVVVAATFAVHGARALAYVTMGNLSLEMDQSLSALTYFITTILTLLTAGGLLLLDTGRLLERTHRATEDLARLNQLKDRLLAVTSHDLRGPLGTLQILWADVSERFRAGTWTAADEPLLGMVGRTLAGTQSLLENLLSFAESQRRPADPKARSSLRTLGALMREQWQGPMEAKGLSFAVEAETDLSVVMDQEEGLAVLRNLVGNAFKFTAPGGQVVLTVVEAGGRAGFAVRDTGIGMDPELVQRVFRFEERQSRPGTEGERGSGFGLVLVKELVDSRGGSLEVESVPGRGTTVRLWLPRAASV